MTCMLEPFCQNFSQLIEIYLQNEMVHYSTKCKYIFENANLCASSDQITAKIKYLLKDLNTKYFQLFHREKTTETTDAFRKMLNED